MPFLSIFFAKLPIMAVEFRIPSLGLAVDWVLFGITMTSDEFCFSGQLKCTKVFIFCQVFNNKVLTIYLSAKSRFNRI